MPPHKPIILTAAASALVVPSPAVACEPIIPLMMVLAGPAFLAQSGLVLLLAVAFKSLAFSRLQTELPKPRAIRFMVLANLLSTAVGVVVGIAVSNGSFWLVGLPLAWFLFLIPAERLIAASPSGSWLSSRSRRGLSSVLTLLLLVSAFLFLFAQGSLISGNAVAYWMLKLLFLYLALTASLVITSFWEEWCVWRLSGSPHATTFATPVFRANAITLGLVAVYAALRLLPTRLHDPDFLAQLLRTLASVLAA